MGSSIATEARRQLGSERLSWTLLSCSPHCLKVQDKTAGIVGDKYTIEEELLERDWQLYLLRHSHPQYLVAIHDILQQQRQTICSTSCQLGIVTEHIPYRLPDLGAIQQREALYIFTAILRGCKVLKDNGVGFYLLDQNNVCFNRKGLCKIWISQNLCQGRPHADRSITETQLLEPIYLMLQARISEKKGFFQRNSAAVKTQTLDCLLRELQRTNNNTLVCMESLKNLNTETQRSNTLALQNITKIISAQRREKSMHKKEQEILRGTSAKKLSLARKKKEPHLPENKSPVSLKSIDISPRHLLQLTKDSPYESAILAERGQKEICNYPQIFSKGKAQSRESGSQALSIQPLPNSSFKKLNLNCNNSTKKV